MILPSVTPSFFVKISWILGELIDAKGIDVAQPVWPWGRPTKAQKQSKNKKKSIMAIKVEPHQCLSHQSILLIQGPIYEIFTKKSWRIGDFEKFSLFELAILIFFPKKFMHFIPKKISHKLWVRIDGIQFVHSER